jgi:hypothetical protein
MKQVTVKICELSRKHASCDNLILVNTVNGDPIQFCKQSSESSAVDYCYYKKNAEITIIIK